jgi:hypothetical protein
VSTAPLRSPSSSASADRRSIAPSNGNESRRELASRSRHQEADPSARRLLSRIRHLGGRAAPGNSPRSKHPIEVGPHWPRHRVRQRQTLLHAHSHRHGLSARQPRAATAPRPFARCGGTWWSAARSFSCCRSCRSRTGLPPIRSRTQHAGSTASKAHRAAVDRLQELGVRAVVASRPTSSHR